MGIKGYLKHLLLATVITMLTACGGGGGSDSPGEPQTIVEEQKSPTTNLVFADQSLADCVQSLIDSKGYTLVEQITQLTCSGLNIIDIEGIEKLFNLETLDLSNNQIRDITPIAELQNLKSLNLNGNDLQVVTPILNLPAIEQIDISSNDAIICSEQNQLEEKFGDSLTKPEACIDGQQQAQDAVFEDTALQACIRQTAQDINAQFLVQITQLECNNQGISTIDGIEQLTNLRELHLSQNNLTEITPLQNLTLLKKVLLGQNQITNIQPLTSSANMQELRLDDNQISDITPIEALTSLKQLLLSNNSIRDITPIQKLTELLELRISNNRIIDIDALANLKKLSSLWIQDNQIANIAAIGQLSSLDQLWLSNNWLTDLSPLQNQTQLRWLHLDGTEVQDLSPLTSLTQLEWLHLENTRVEDITAIYPLTKLNWLHLKGNNAIPCSQLDQMEQILTPEKIERPESCSQPQAQIGTPISTIEFEDQALRDCVYDAAKEQGVENTNELTSLSCNGGEGRGQITDITELQELPELQEIDLIGNDNIACTQLDNLRYSHQDANLTLPEACNNAPYITVTAEQTVLAGEQTTIIVEVTDPDEDQLTYSWQQTAGEAVELTNANTQSPSFTAPGQEQTLTFQLTVTDPYGLTATQTITILVTAPLGSKANPFLVTSYEDLKKVGTGVDGWNLDSHYLQTADIDASPSATENPIPDAEGEYYGFEPIGNSDTPFTGGYDGGGFAIDGLSINRVEHGGVGMFQILDGGVIQNIGLLNISILSESGSAAGGLVGINARGVVLNSYVTGSISAVDLVYVGGLIGLNNEGIVSGSYVDTDISHEISNDSVLSAFVGGVAGLNSGEITKCYAQGDVSFYASSEYANLHAAGGLTGLNTGTIGRSFVFSDVSGKSAVGGLAGINAEHISGSMGGLDSVLCKRRNVSDYPVVIKGSYAVGTITAENRVGGLTGLNCNHIENSYARGNVSGNSQVGGLVGQMQHSEGDDENPAQYSSITNSYSTGQVLLQDEELEPIDFGGLVGASTSELNTISNSFWDIETSGIQISAGGESKTSEELKTTATFTNAGWDFDETWMILSEGYTYPRLAFNTIEVDSWTDLSNMRNNMHANYVLTRDLLTTDADYAELAGPEANEGQGWEPVGSPKQPFMGTFNGSGFTIDGLTINRPEENHIGLFGYSISALYRDIYLENASIQGLNYVGGIVGHALSSYEPLLLLNIHFYGEITGDTVSCGGIAGHITSGKGAIFSDNSSNADVDCYNFTGGMIGQFSGSKLQLINSTFAGTVSAQMQVGGVLGAFSGIEIYADNISSSGEVLTKNESQSFEIGGLFGGIHNIDDFELSNSHSSMNISRAIDATVYEGLEGSKIGGLIGALGALSIPEQSNISGCYAEGDITIEGEADQVGGMVGFAAASYSYVNKSFATGNISVAAGSTFIGGVFGFYQSGLGSLTNVYSTGNVLAEGASYVGGLIGQFNGELNGGYSAGLVEGGDSTGGLIGSGSSTVTNSFWDIETSGQETSAGGAGLTTEEMQNQYIYESAGWDFETIWKMEPGSYPVLQ